MNDPEMLARFDSKGKVVRLDEGAHETAEVKIVSRTEMRAELAKAQ